MDHEDWFNRLCADGIQVVDRAYDGQGDDGSAIMNDPRTRESFLPIRFLETTKTAGPCA